MKVDAINRAMELINLANKSDTNFDFKRKQKTLTKFDNKTNANLKQDNQQFAQDEDGIRQVLSPGYQVDHSGLFREIVKLGDNFVYEDYLIKMIYSSDKEFKKLYNKVNDVNFLSLPVLIEEISEELIRLCDERRIYISEEKIYNHLLQKYKYTLALEYFFDNVVDVKFNDEKVLKIYKKLEKHNDYTKEEAEKEIWTFANLVNLLAC